MPAREPHVDPKLSQLAHGYSDEFWKLSPLQQAVMITLKRTGNPMQEGELKAELRSERALYQTLRALSRRRLVDHVHWFAYVLSDEGRSMMGVTPSRPVLRVIDGGAA